MVLYIIWFVRREGIEPLKRVFTYVLFLASHFFKGTKCNINFSKKKIIMPYPFIGPKLSWAGPNFLCHIKDLFTFCGSNKNFVADKKMICIQ